MTFALDQHVSLSLCTDFHRNRVVIAHFKACTSSPNMAATAILEAVDPARFWNFSTQLVSRSLCIKFHRNRVVLVHVIAFTSINILAVAAILKLDQRLRFCYF
jgi:hypothetical protein